MQLLKILSTALSTVFICAAAIAQNEPPHLEFKVLGELSSCEILFQSQASTIALPVRGKPLRFDAISEESFIRVRVVGNRPSLAPFQEDIRITKPIVFGLDINGAFYIELRKGPNELVLLTAIKETYARLEDMKLEDFDEEEQATQGRALETRAYMEFEQGSWEDSLAGKAVVLKPTSKYRVSAFAQISTDVLGLNLASMREKYQELADAGFEIPKFEEKNIDEINFGISHKQADIRYILKGDTLREVTKNFSVTLTVPVHYSDSSME